MADGHSNLAVRVPVKLILSIVHHAALRYTAENMQMCIPMCVSAGMPSDTITLTTFQKSACSQVHYSPPHVLRLLFAAVPAALWEHNRKFCLLVRNRQQHRRHLWIRRWPDQFLLQSAAWSNHHVSYPFAMLFAMYVVSAAWADRCEFCTISVKCCNSGHRQI